MEIMNRIEINITPEVKDILDKYDTEKLLNTIPRGYQIVPTALAVYSRTAKPDPSPTLITISEASEQYLNATAQNLNAPISLVFNFLIETVVDCGKIQTKSITRALNNYYKVASNSFDDEKSKTLFKKVLDGYSNSGFYDYYQCLSEEGIADFLTISEEGKALVDEIEEYNKNK